MSHASDARALRKQLQREGFSVELTSSDHWEVRYRGERVSTFPKTPSDRRWYQNALGDLRRWKKSQGIGQRSRSLYLTVPQEPMAGTHQGARRKLRRYA